MEEAKQAHELDATKNLDRLQKEIEDIRNTVLQQQKDSGTVNRSPKTGHLGNPEDCNGRCGRKQVRAQTTHYNCPSLSLRRCPPKRSELRQEPKGGLSTLVGRETVGTGEGDLSPAATSLLLLIGSIGTERIHAWTYELSSPDTRRLCIAMRRQRASLPGFIHHATKHQSTHRYYRTTRAEILSLTGNQDNWVELPLIHK